MQSPQTCKSLPANLPLSYFAMFQTHPLDVNGNILRRFYEPLVLLNVLDPTRGAQRPDLITDRGLDEHSKLWRNFLDQLSWLCDSEKGGDTVTAIGAQKTVQGSIFWLASNSNSRKKGQDHLKWVLAQLNRLYAGDSMSTIELENQITTRCINLSSRRIKTYKTWLLQCTRKAKHAMKGWMNPEGTR